MTPQERAEKIVFGLGPKELQGERYATSFEKDLIQRIAAQIESAEREAVDQFNRYGYRIESNPDKAFKDGWNAAKEKARGIAEKCDVEEWSDGGKTCSVFDMSNKYIADRIAKMEPGE